MLASIIEIIQTDRIGLGCIYLNLHKPQHIICEAFYKISLCTNIMLPIYHIFKCMSKY